MQEKISSLFRDFNEHTRRGALQAFFIHRLYERRRLRKCSMRLCAHAESKAIVSFWQVVISIENPIVLEADPAWFKRRDK